MNVNVYCSQHWGILAELAPSSVKFGIHSGTLTVCYGNFYGNFTIFDKSCLTKWARRLPVNGQITKRIQEDDIQLFIHTVYFFTYIILHPYFLPFNPNINFSCIRYKLYHQINRWLHLHISDAATVFVDLYVDLSSYVDLSDNWYTTHGIPWYTWPFAIFWLRNCTSSWFKLEGYPGTLFLDKPMYHKYLGVLQIRITSLELNSG